MPHRLTEPVFTLSEHTLTTEFKRLHRDWLTDTASSTRSPSSATMLAAEPQPIGHHQLAQVAACFRAAPRTPVPGDPLRDWLMVEAAIAQMFPFPRKKD
jgi:hypothetical protein